MVAKTVNAEESQLPELLLLARDGMEVIITQDDKPVARLIPIASSNKTRVAGLNRGAAWVSEDFDESLPEEFWAGVVRSF